MKISITIECDTINEIQHHLAVLSKQIKKKAKKEKLEVFDDEFSNGIGLDDDNCYGSHFTAITD